MALISEAREAATWTLRREMELLLCCSRTVMGPESARHARSLVHPGLDWDSLFDRALRHGVVQLLDRGLNSACHDLVPEEIQRRLRDYCLSSALHSRYLGRELQQILEVLDSSGVPALPFKGPALSQMAYGDATLRPASDLDILVEREDVPRVKRVLQSRGYRPWVEMTPRQEAAQLRIRYNYKLVGPTGRMLLEVHWAIAPRQFGLSLDFQELWDRRVELSWLGRYTQSLSPEDLFLVLVIHGDRHGWRRLQWVCDLAELVRATPKMDWASVIQRARARRSLRRVLLALALVEQVLGSFTPDVRGLPDAELNRLNALVDEVRAGLYGREDLREASLRLSLFHLKTMDTAPDRLRYLSHPLRHTLFQLGRRLVPLHP
jgi:hypothetical protein